MNPMNILSIIVFIFIHISFGVCKNGFLPFSLASPPKQISQKLNLTKRGLIRNNFAPFVHVYHVVSVPSGFLFGSLLCFRMSNKTCECLIRKKIRNQKLKKAGGHSGLNINNSTNNNDNEMNLN